MQQFHHDASGLIYHSTPGPLTTYYPLSEAQEERKHYPAQTLKDQSSLGRVSTARQLSHEGSGLGTVKTHSTNTHTLLCRSATHATAKGCLHLQRIAHRLEFDTSIARCRGLFIHCMGILLTYTVRAAGSLCWASNWKVAGLKSPS